MKSLAKFVSRPDNVIITERVVTILTGKVYTAQFVNSIP